MIRVVGVIALSLLVGRLCMIARSMRCAVCYRSFAIFADDRCRRHRVHGHLRRAR